MSGRAFYYWAGNWRSCLSNSKVWLKEGNSEVPEGECLERFPRGDTAELSRKGHLEISK